MQLKSAVQFSITFHQLQTGESTNLKKLIKKFLAAVSEFIASASANKSGSRKF
jgi:hypothetical protein